MDYPDQSRLRPGELANIIAHLESAKINITAMTGRTAGQGRFGAILWVKPRDVKKAANILGAG